MYLIYVSARSSHNEPKTAKKQTDPVQDLQPIMLALNCDNDEYLLREGDTKDIDIDKPEGAENVERVFVRLKCVSESMPGDEISLSGEGMDESGECGKAQLAVALATIYFAKGQEKPLDTVFAKHIKERSRIADVLVVAGYTDAKCTLRDSERIAMQRARAVREVLSAEGVKTPIIAIARPSCAFASTDKASRRVEVTALFRSGGPVDDDPGPGRKAKASTKKRGGSSRKEARQGKQTRKAATGVAVNGAGGKPTIVSVATTKKGG